MNTTSTDEVPEIRFSLRTLLAITTAAALLTFYFVWLSKPAKSSSPDKPAYWVHQFHNGTRQEREAAVNVIASHVRKGNVSPALIDVLCEAATDKNVKNRLSAVLGLDKLKSKDSHAKSVLEKLAKNDPDSNVKSMAQQALDVGISSNP